MDVERNLNNRPLTHVEAEEGVEEVFMPNGIMCRGDAYPAEDKLKIGGSKSP